MEDKQSNIKNNLNIANNNQDNPNFNQPQNNVNINDNNILQFQSLNNNQFMQRYGQNYNNLNNNNPYYNNNIQIPGLYEQNQMFNNINNKNTNNSYKSNYPISQNNNYFQNDQQSKKTENKNKSKNLPKRTNYLPKNIFKNQSQIPPNENYINQYYQTPYPNMPYNAPNINQISNYENNYENKSNNNYNQDNEIDKNFSNIITEIKNDENKINKDIKSNKVFKVFSYIFNDKMEDVAEVLTDENLFKEACPSDIIDKIVFQKFSKDKSKDCYVLLTWKKFYNVKLIIYNQYWGKYHINYSLKSIEMKPVNIGSLEMNFKYYYNTCQNNTLYITEFFIDQGILSEVFKEELFDNDLKRLCIGCEKILRERKKEKIHSSSLIINISKEKVWNNIIDLNKKRYINYMNKYNLYYLCKDEIKRLNIGDSKNLENEIKEDNSDYHHIQKGDFIIIRKSQNEIFSKLKVDEIKEEKDKNEIILVCDKEAKQPKQENKINSGENKEEKNNQDNIKVLNQKLVLSIKEITKDICYLEFKHIWKDWVNINKINTLDILKTNSLKIFEQLLLKNNNESEKKDIKTDKSVISLFNLLCPIEL